MMVERCLRAEADPVLTRDPRVMEQLLASEGRAFRHVHHRCYFSEVQEEIQPHMRRTVAKWMLEVCEEQGADDVVFPLAMSYVDRFLASVSIRKGHLQLLGAVCLMLASKLRQCRAFSMDTLIYYTDYSVTTHELATWELMVLSRLKWDMASVIAYDFVDPIVSRLDIEDRDVVKRHTNTFIALCATEYKFTSYSPSLLATASVASAVNGLPWLEKPWSSLQGLLADLQGITGIHINYIRICMADIEELVSLNIAQLHQTMLKAQFPATGGCKINCYPTAAESGHSQPETPTDVQDVLI